MRPEAMTRMLRFFERLRAPTNPRRDGRRLSAFSMAVSGVLALPMALAAGTNDVTVAGGAVDWRDQVLYLVMIDRFEDGDPGNNDQGAGEYDPADPRKFSGGDLAGVEKRLDYIRGLGATAIWITPPVANRWWSEHAQFGGYHGYWARDFKRLDAHFGTLDAYKRLARAMHAREMRLVQDVVVNHMADYHGWNGPWDPTRPEQGFVLRPEADGTRAPPQPPFDRNDVRKNRDRNAAIYHWNPPIRDHGDREQQLNWQLADLDDLNTENPAVRAALRDSYGYWIREVGVDGFRVDTAIHVPPEFFEDFLRAEDPKRPGVLKVAAAEGKPDFHVFGEGFGIDKGFDDRMARKIETYARDPDGRPLLPAMINFPLYGTLTDVFARKRAPGELAHRIDNMMRVHADPWRMPTFVDNHDVDRFLAGGDEAGLKQALLAIMTLPGIPTIYYGTEQGFREQRGAMFAGGYASGGRDRFDTDAPIYRYLTEMSALRRSHRVFSRGVPTVLMANAAAPGAIAWRMSWEGEDAFVVFNTADHTTLIDRLDTGLPEGVWLQPLYGLGEQPAPRVMTRKRGRLSLQMPPRSAWVWRANDGDKGVGVSFPPAQIALDPAPPSVVGDLALSGRALDLGSVQIVVDGDLASAQTVPVGRDGRWRARVRTDDMIEPGVAHRVVAWDPDSNTASPPHEFDVARAWTQVAAVEDPADDDAGPTGRYTYPTGEDDGWRKRRPGDLLGTTVWRSGGALRLQLKPRALMADWNPPNGFDHVAFTVFIEIPGRDGGATAMPGQNAMLPDGMRWHLRLRTFGWSNVLFSAEGATATADGAAIGAAHLELDREAGTVTYTFPARAFGDGDAGPVDLAGARIYVSTWDYDGGFRALAPEASGNTFGGGAPDGPKVMDDVLIRLPR
jgi:glycosidase